jgi:hypothetical protein
MRQVEDSQIDATIEFARQKDVQFCYIYTGSRCACMRALTSTNRSCATIATLPFVRNNCRCTRVAVVTALQRQLICTHCVLVRTCLHTPVQQPQRITPSIVVRGRVQRDC